MVVRAREQWHENSGQWSVKCEAEEIAVIEIAKTKPIYSWC